VKPAKVSQAVFANYPWSKIELMSEVLSTVRRDASGRVAWLVQTLDMQERTGASDEDADGFVNYPMSCGDVEACAFFKETAPNVYRVSLRSKCDVNVARIAERFRGGGHRNAAGCTFNGTWDEAEREVVGQLVYAVEHRGENGTGALALPQQQEIVPAPEPRKHERDART
jgi:phosphoesterase RecJ-like protein